MKTDNQPQHTQGEITLRYAKQTKVLIGAELNGKPLFRMEDDFSYAEKVANAQRIVKAVNMHDELVKLLGKFLKYETDTEWRKLKEIRATEASDGNVSYMDTMVHEAEKLFKQSEGK